MTRWSLFHSIGNGYLTDSNSKHEFCEAEIVYEILMFPLSPPFDSRMLSFNSLLTPRLHGVTMHNSKQNTSFRS